MPRSGDPSDIVDCWVFGLRPAAHKTRGRRGSINHMQNKSILQFGFAERRNACIFLFLLLLCVWDSSIGVKASVFLRKLTTEVVNIHFHLAPSTSVCKWCRTRFTNSGALRRLQNGTRSLGNAVLGAYLRRSPHLPAAQHGVALPRLAGGWQGSHTPPLTLRLPLSQEAEEGTPQQAAGSEPPSFPCQGNPLPARPAAPSSFHTSVTFLLKVNRPKQGRISYPRAADCQQPVLLPSVKGKQQQLTLLPQAQEH